MSTEAKKRGNEKHIEKLDLIKVQPYKEQGQAIRAAAAIANQSVQGYVLQAVIERMEREGIAMPPAPHPETRGRKASSEIKVMPVSSDTETKSLRK